MIEVSTGLYQLLHADVQSGGAGSLGTLGALDVFDSQAPENQAYPFVVFQLVSGLPVYTKGRRVWRDLLYDVKAVDDGTHNSDRGRSKTRAAALDNRCDALLTDHEANLTVTGFLVENVRRESDIEIPVTDDGKRYWVVGGSYRIQLGV